MVSFALHGVGVSGGIAIGRAQLVSHATLEVAHYMIPAGKGAKVVVEVDGPDETAAMEAIVALIGDYFGEGQ